MAHYGPIPGASYDGVSISRHNVLHERGDFAVIEYTAAVQFIKHSNPTSDLGLAKSWADTLAELLPTTVDMYLGYQLPPSSSAVSSTTISTNAPYTYTLTTAGTTGFIRNVSSNTITIRTTAGSPVILSPGQSYFPGVYTTIEPTSNSLVYATKYYTIVRKSDVGLVEEPAKPVVEDFDGLTRSECLHAYVRLMRSEGKITVRMTKRQLEVARAEWSKELKRLASETEHKKRHQVVVDLDDE